MSLYSWLSLPIGLIGIGLICYCEYRLQVIVTQYQLRAMSQRRSEREFLNEVADFKSFVAKVSVVSVTIAFTALYFVLSKEFGMWAFTPLTVLILAVMAKLLPLRIGMIRSMKREMREALPTSPSPPPINRQITSRVIIDAE